jgi:hypothetical protein
MRILPLACLIAVSGFAQTFTAVPLPNPSGNGGLQANWSATPHGGAVLSWTEPSKGGLYDLRYAVRRDSGWSEPRTIATNRHFFRHPAELPEVIELSDTLWLAHWVEMPKESSDEEFIYVSSSTDGLHWTPPLIAHKDRSPVQHGLVSMIPSGAGEASLFWLETPKGEDGPGYLMRTVVSASGQEMKEEQIDTDVCSCCSTAVANTAKGLLVAYRDHTPADIRDISVVRLENGRWTQPKNVHADNWKLNACPVNGPAIAAKGDRAAVSWFTAAKDSPRTEIALSSDSGSTFGNPVVVSTGHSEGYTSVVLDENGNAVVSWIEQGGGASRLLVRAVTPAGVAGPILQVASGTRASLGYPRLVQTGKDTLVAWGGPNSKILTAALRK